MMSVIDMLALEQLDRDLFRGRTAVADAGRVFGGAAVAQSLLAAYATVEDRVCHSLHAYFILPGDPALPILFEVDRARDGGSFATRRVIAVQDGRQILNLAASFQRPDVGFEHQLPATAHPRPDDLIDDDQRGDAVGLQLRNVELPRPGFDDGIRPPRHGMWFRSRRPLGDRIAAHQAALAYASDFPMLPAMIQPHPVRWQTPGFQYVSLDHAMWFHRPFDFTAWHLCDMDTPASSGGRGISRGLVYGEDGTLVASVVQEAVIRLRPPKA